MALTYGFFNSVRGDRVYNADQISEYFDGLVSDGVYQDVGSAFVVTASATMSVSIGTGRAVVGGKWVKNDSSYSLMISTPDSTYPRYTAVVIELRLTDRAITIKTLDGTPATVPEKPSLINTETVKQLCLAYIYVPANTAAIVQSMITDNRSGTGCGWVTGLIEQIDTSTLFLQWQDAYEQQYEAFETWFSHLTEQLNVDTYIQRYVKKIVTQAGTNTYALDPDGYTYEASDIIDVYINGLAAVDDTDYFIDEPVTGTGTITLNGLSSGNTVIVKITKSKIGFTQP